MGDSIVSPYNWLSQLRITTKDKQQQLWLQQWLGLDTNYLSLLIVPLNKQTMVVVPVASQGSHMMWMTDSQCHLLPVSHYRPGPPPSISIASRDWVSVSTKDTMKSHGGLVIVDKCMYPQLNIGDVEMLPIREKSCETMRQRPNYKFHLNKVWAFNFYVSKSQSTPPATTSFGEIKQEVSSSGIVAAVLLYLLPLNEQGSLTVLKDQHEPHCPWFFTGVTYPMVLQSTESGRPLSNIGERYDDPLLVFSDCL